MRQGRIFTGWACKSCCKKITCSEISGNFPPLLVNFLFEVETWVFVFSSNCKYGKGPLHLEGGCFSIPESVHDIGEPTQIMQDTFEKCYAREKEALTSIMNEMLAIKCSLCFHYQYTWTLIIYNLTVTSLYWNTYHFDRECASSLISWFVLCSVCDHVISLTERLRWLEIWSHFGC